MTLSITRIKRDIQQNVIQRNNSEQNDIQQNDIQRNDTQHKNKQNATLNIQHNSRALIF